MLTTVRREILDHSISGNKIFGGDINWIDGLYTDYIQIPHAAIGPENGGGLVDGPGLLIGSRSPIGILESLSVKARTEFGLRNAAFTGYSIYGTRVTGGAEFRVRNSAGSTRVYLGTGTAQKSYFLDKLIVGKITNDNPSSALEASTGFIDTLIFGTLSGPAGTINLLSTKDPLDATVSLTSIIGLVYALNTFVLEEPFLTLADMTAAQAGQLLNITESPAIEAENWSHLPSLNQDLGTGDAPTFDGIRVGQSPLPVGADNLLVNYLEWLDETIVVDFVVGSVVKISCNAKVNIVKNGKLVMISVYGTGMSAKIEFVNTSGVPITGGNFRIILDEKYDAICINSPVSGLSAGMLHYEVYNGSLVLQSRPQMFCSAPDFDPKHIVFLDLLTVDQKITIPNNYKIVIPPFTMSYVSNR